MADTLNTIDPTSFLNRSTLYRLHVSRGANYEAVDDSAIVRHYGDEAAECETAHRLALADLTALPRVGFKGKGAPDWLKSRHVKLPNDPNCATQQDDGCIVAALSWEEHLILSDINGQSELSTKLDRDWSLEDSGGCYKLARANSHCWLAISGEQCPAMLAKICGIDMRLDKFPDGSVAQTSLARLSAIIIRSDISATAVFHILADSASAEFLWACILDAMREYQGGIVGVSALRALAQE